MLPGLPRDSRGSPNGSKHRRGCLGGSPSASGSCWKAGMRTRWRALRSRESRTRCGTTRSRPSRSSDTATSPGRYRLGVLISLAAPRRACTSGRCCPRRPFDERAVAEELSRLIGAGEHDPRVRWLNDQRGAVKVNWRKSLGHVPTDAEAKRLRVALSIELGDEWVRERGWWVRSGPRLECPIRAQTPRSVSHDQAA